VARHALLGDVASSNRSPRASFVGSVEDVVVSEELDLGCGVNAVEGSWLIGGAACVVLTALAGCPVIERFDKTSTRSTALTTRRRPSTAIGSVLVLRRTGLSISNEPRTLRSRTSWAD